MATKTNRGKTVALWMLGAVALAVAFYFDDAVMRFSGGIPDGSALDTFGRKGSHYGELQFLLIPCVIVAVIAWLKRKESVLHLLCIMLISTLLAGAVGANVVRATTGRTRPSAPAEIEQGWYGPRANGKWVVLNSRYNAFPSAHSAASMGLIAPLLLMRRRIGWLLLPVPLVIAFARICANAHHLSDVVAGLLLGLAVGQWVVWKIAPRIAQWRIFKTSTEG